MINLNVPVSKFNDVYSKTPSTTIALIDWLTDTRKADEVEFIRQEPNKLLRIPLKRVLPAITPSGIFSSLDEDRVISHSGFIQFDIDDIHSKHFGPIRRAITEMPYTVYAGLSVSGKGLWGFFKVSNPEMHFKHFDAMQFLFKRIGVFIDSFTRDVHSLRSYSYDPKPYINLDAKVFDYIKAPIGGNGDIIRVQELEAQKRHWGIPNYDPVDIKSLIEN